jgi:exocyst complex component 3
MYCRIEGNQLEDRLSNKMWLVRHLELTRQLMIEDLRVVMVWDILTQPRFTISLIIFTRNFNYCK